MLDLAAIIACAALRGSFNAFFLIQNSGREDATAK
jgi:hypothetical protein